MSSKKLVGMADGVGLVAVSSMFMFANQNTFTIEMGTQADQVQKSKASKGQVDRMSVSTLPESILSRNGWLAELSVSIHRRVQRKTTTGRETARARPILPTLLIKTRPSIT